MPRSSERGGSHLIDTEENLNKLLPFLDEIISGGLITLEKVRVIRYRHGNKDKR
ncbi:MAG: hypothetical protein EF813_11525 [Methanosarcinales archaeon]|nr:MAG: hypothetical protein EF813_11525 [Methanosarcinales archaeon]